ncbi:MAG: DegT/DnrJ/EryC1/StrS family aminotransferase [Clostridia bacterium]
MEKRIFLSSPHMCGEEMKYIQEAFDTNWVAPLGKNVDMFEQEICQYVGREFAVALSSGSAAIHLGLRWLGVGENDIVFCSSFTFIGSCNAIDYCKAKPVFVDSEYSSWNMSAVALEKAYEKYPRPKAIVIVNLYGNPADFERLLAIAKAHGTAVLEDAAESLGSRYKGIATGSFGDVSIVSFNGNKIITTSGGGMALVNDKKARDKMLFWATQSRENSLWYQHEEIGYNYRLSNICAGIGRGQLTALDLRVCQKRKIFQIYCEEFANVEQIKMIPEPKNCFCNHWLSLITLSRECKTTFVDIINALAKENIESRPAWKPMHMQPVYANCDFFSSLDKGSVAQDLFERSLCLPSDTKMTESQVRFVAEIVKKTIAEKEK